MGKLLLLCGGAIVLAVVLGRLRRLLGMCAMLCAAAAAVAVFLLPLDGLTLWERAQREGLPEEIATAASGAWRWVMERVPGTPAQRNPRWRKGTEPLARAQERLGRWDDDASEDQDPESDAVLVNPPPKERLSDEDRTGLDRLVTGRGR